MKIDNINVIGAGSLGSFTVQILNKMSPIWQCPINVWDFDVVEEHNLNNQLYSSQDIGKPKVESLLRIISTLDEARLRTINSAVNNTTDLRGLVIVAVDSMLARRMILDLCSFNYGVDYLIEARMGGHMGRVFGLDPKHPDAINRYLQSYYKDDEANNPVCATNETIPALWVAAASIAHLVLLYRKAIVLKNNFIDMTINIGDKPIVNTNSYALI